MHLPVSRVPWYNLSPMLLGILLSVFCAGFAGRSAAAIQDDFVEAYFLVQESEKDLNLGNYPEVRAKITKAREGFLQIKREHPEWDPVLIQFHIEACDRKLRDLDSIEKRELNPARVKPDPAGPELRSESHDNGANLPPEVEARIRKMEQELAKQKKGQEGKLEELRRENARLRERHDAATNELQEARTTLQALEREKRMGGDLVKQLQGELDGVEQKLKALDALKSERVQALIRENDLLKAKSYLTELELSKTRTLLDIQNGRATTLLSDEPAASPDPSPREELSTVDPSESGVKHRLEDAIQGVEDDLQRTANRLRMAGKTNGAGEPLPLPPIQGRIALVRASEGQVVVHFQDVTKIPKGAEMGVYRKGVLMGSVRLGSDIKPPFASCQVLSGTPMLGDEIR